MTFFQRSLRARILLAVACALSISLGAGAHDASAAQGSGPMQALQRAQWVQEGSRRPKHVLYVFMDANCPYCHTLWLALQPYYRQGLQVRDLFVGIIAPSSPAKAAAILDASDPAKAVRDNELHWGVRSDGGGGIAPAFHPTDANTAALAHNVALMQDFGVQGTPGIVYADARGEVHVIAGTPAADKLHDIIQDAAVPAN